jgi:shikimate kinase
MMGAGKTTIGAALAARLGRPFVDTDREVERRARRRIAEIFAEQGEAAFRRVETDVVEEAGAEGAVVALGGGAVLAPGVMDRLLERGVVVFLSADAETLAGRIGDGSSRPLLAGLDPEARVGRIAALLAERMPVYARATLEVEARGPVEDVVDRIVEKLRAA